MMVKLSVNVSGKKLQKCRLLYRFFTWISAWRIVTSL